MIKTRIITDAEPLEKILAGAEKLYKAVGTTMGPRGSNVIIRKHQGRVFVTHDGVTVAKAVKLEDPAEDMAADLLREAASKLDATTGDGTTTVTVLAYNILDQAAQLVRAGENPMQVKLAMDALTEQIVKAIRDLSTEVTKESQLVAVASVAAGTEIGTEVGKAVFEAGKDTPVVLDFSDGTETTTEVISGIKIASGPASPYLLDNAGLSTEIKNPRVIVVDAKLRDKDDILPILQTISQLPSGERQFLLIATEIAGDALSLLVVNRLKAFANIGAIKVPQNILSSAEYLSDIALSTGATVLSRNTGNSIREPQLAHFGSAQKATISLTETIIADGGAIQEDLDHRLGKLEETIASAKKKEVREFAESRIKFLSQKVLSIHVGGQSESEAEERHYRYEDAVGACRAALRQGFVPGGGTLLHSIADELGDTPVEKAVAAALGSPMHIVLRNAGAEVHCAEVGAGHGIDVLNPSDGVVDLVARGIVDPTESEVEAVRTALTIAGLLLTSGAIIVDEEVSREAEQQIAFG